MPGLNNLTSEQRNVYDEVRSQLEEYGLGELSNTLVSLIQQYGAGMKETIKTELRNTTAYKNRFAGNEARRAAGRPVLSEAQYLYNETAYAETLKAYNSGDLATQTNFAEFMGRDISPAELSQRFSMAVNKVQNADPALKRQLQQMYPGIADTDLARSLLMGTEGSAYLKTRVGQAEILAEASTAGVNLMTDVAALEAQGVTRAQATKGLAQIAAKQAGTQQAASMFGEDVSAGTLQQELESEALLGQTSKRTKRLASQARGQFSGRTGIAKTGLGESRAGQL